MRIIRSADISCMPWQNGGGETSELARHPPDAGLDAFAWRVSLAKVAAGGPFSIFRAVDRTLAILEGAGLRLSIAGRAPIELTSASAPCSFPADLPTTAALTDGPVLVLNVMTRRGVAEHAVDRQSMTGKRELRLDCSAALLVCRLGGLTILNGNAAAELYRDEALLLDPCPPNPLRLDARPTADLYLVRLRLAPT